MARNLLITGGAGFIGSRLTKSWAQTNPGDNIWIIDNLLPQVHGPNASPPHFDGNVRFICGDVTDKYALRDVVNSAKPEIIFHLAAETGTGQSYDEVSRYCDVNVTGTANLIEAVRSESNSVTKRIVLSASRAIYGEGGYKDAVGNIFTGLPRQNDLMRDGVFDVPMPPAAKYPVIPVPSDANLVPAPASIYASTKLMQEYILNQTGEGSGWTATILRFQNVYGPGQSLHNPYTGVLSIFAQQLISGKTLSIYEDGRISRDFVFIDDVIDSLKRAGEISVDHGEIIDIGSGEAITILEMAQIMMRALGLADDKYKITGEYRVGDIRHACANILKAGKLLNWKPTVSVEDGIRNLCDWAEKEYKIDR